MSKINYNNIDLDDLDDELFDELYEDEKKPLPKFKDEFSNSKRKTKNTRKKDTPKN